MINQALFSSERMDWATPQDLFDALNLEFAFTLDPCADAGNHKCPRYFTKEQNGPAQDWTGERVFCNPPYGRWIGLWISEIDKFCDLVTRVRFHDQAAPKGVNMPTFTIDTDKIKDLDSIHAAINGVAACLSRENLQIINDEFTEIANLSPIKPTSWTLKRMNELLDKANLLLFDNKTRTN